MEEEVQVEGGVEGEEKEEDTAEGTVVGVEFLMGKMGEVGDWGVGGLEGEEVVERELRGGDDAEAFREVKIVYERF